MTINTFEELVEAVREIDPKAAEYLESADREMEDFDKDPNLDCVMIWRYTPQGSDYWADIYTQLEKNNDPTKL